jgi:predicted nucleic acid-binding protein
MASEGLLDTSVFIHAQTHDQHSDECRRFLAAVESGHISAVIEAPVLHELSYALRHYRKEMTRSQVAAYLLMILGWDGIRGETSVLADTVTRWRDTPGLAFIDAYLAAVAKDRGCPVYTKNIDEIATQGIDVPRRLPAI